MGDFLRSKGWRGFDGGEFGQGLGDEYNKDINVKLIIIKKELRNSTLF